jgi:hypothetical protein
VNTVSRKYKAAVEHLKESNSYVSELSEAIDDSVLEKWTGMISMAESGRTSDVKAMDVFNANLDKGKPSLDVPG